MFGGLLSAKPEVSIDETGSAPPANGDKEGKEGDVRLKPVWTTKTGKTKFIFLGILVYNCIHDLKGHK